jgi:putative Mg2+ transporter-C (MgtC) family protein
MLIGIGSATYMLLAEYLMPRDPDAISRTIQGFLSGIGFLGGAVIFKSGFDVRGIKAAAAVWITGAIGLAVATSDWQLAVTVGILTTVLLFIADRFPDPVREQKKEESVADAGEDVAIGNDPGCGESFRGLNSVSAVNYPRSDSWCSPETNRQPSALARLSSTITVVEEWMGKTALIVAAILSLSTSPLAIAQTGPGGTSGSGTAGTGVGTSSTPGSSGTRLQPGESSSTTGNLGTTGSMGSGSGSTTDPSKPASSGSSTGPGTSPASRDSSGSDSGAQSPRSTGTSK